MAYKHPLDWVRSLTPDFDHAGSFRHMRRFAIEEAAQNERWRADIVEKGGEATAVAEWDDPANERAWDALHLIEKRMSELGFKLDPIKDDPRNWLPAERLAKLWPRTCV